MSSGFLDLVVWYTFWVFWVSVGCCGFGYVGGCIWWVGDFMNLIV